MDRLLLYYNTGLKDYHLSLKVGDVTISRPLIPAFFRAVHLRKKEPSSRTTNRDLRDGIRNTNLLPPLYIWAAPPGPFPFRVDTHAVALSVVFKQVMRHVKAAHLM
jgi:hypothetical protein